jgi:hypothetical protein
MRHSNQNQNNLFIHNHHAVKYRTPCLILQVYKIQKYAKKSEKRTWLIREIIICHHKTVYFICNKLKTISKEMLTVGILTLSAKAWLHKRPKNKQEFLHRISCKCTYTCITNLNYHFKITEKTLSVLLNWILKPTILNFVFIHFLIFIVKIGCI